MLSINMFKQKIILEFFVAVDFIQMTKDRPKRGLEMVNDLQQLTTTCSRMQDMLSQVMQYVDNVVVCHGFANHLILNSGLSLWL